LEEFKKEDTAVVALSVDPLDKAKEMAAKTGATFPIGYDLKVPQDADKVGAYWEERRGIIHATNPGKHRIERYTPDDRLLGHIGRFNGIDPAGFSGCCNPTNVTVAGRDRLYVTEKAEPRAKVYDFQGNLKAVIATDVFDPKCKNMGIAVDRRGRVWVADTVRLEIIAFEGDAAS